ncbi:MAG: GNAT family N-acetyltransferase [Bacteroidota bacterium]
MLTYKIYDSINLTTTQEKNQLVEFLYTHLDEFRDSKTDITKAIDYALKITSDDGGFILAGYYGKPLVGAVVINRTGMQGYIPENILVFIAVDKTYRGKGFGKMLMKEAMKLAKGDIALHVEPNNPARFLYEKLGFTSKYIEMRYKKEVNEVS